jgi:hypothetical protein
MLVSNSTTKNKRFSIRKKSFSSRSLTDQTYFTSLLSIVHRGLFNSLLRQAIADATEAKTEYDIILAESRDPDIREAYGAEQVCL